MPPVWSAIYSRLMAAREASDKAIPEPPSPLILGGWVSTNDVEKRLRWQSTVAWAARWGVSHLIGELSPDQMYRVSSLTDYEVGPMGGPMYLPWNWEPRDTVSPEAAARALDILRSTWTEIAGDHLAQSTRPLRLTGRKRRRLLVFAQNDMEPPWGSWASLGPGIERRSFTRLRAAVNSAIAPLEVDHIDFVHSQTK